MVVYLGKNDQYLLHGLWKWGPFGEFDFNVEKEKMYLTVTEDGRIVEVIRN